MKDLLQKLAAGDPAGVEKAAESVLSSPGSLKGAPPPELLAALAAGAAVRHEPLLNLVRAWSRVDMSRALLDALDRATTVDGREQFAWLLKIALCVEHSSEAIQHVFDNAEDAQVRRWLLEALERLAFAGTLGWDQLSGVVSLLAGERHPTLRAALASMLMALPWRPCSGRLLEPLLLDSDHEVVSAAAHTLAGHHEAVRELNPTTLAHLRGHSNPVMRHSATQLDDALRHGGGS